MPCLQELVLSLIDLLVNPALSPHYQQATSDDIGAGLMGSPNTKGPQLTPGCFRIGLPQLTPGGLHTSIWGVVISCLDQDADICSHFWRHAMPMIPQWFQLSVNREPHESASKEIFATICGEVLHVSGVQCIAMQASISLSASTALTYTCSSVHNKGKQQLIGCLCA